MKSILAMSALLIAFALPAAATPPQVGYPSTYEQPQGWHGVLAADEQAQFDKYYSKWLDATRKNDQDDISGNARHMQDIMARNNIPLNVPFDQIASIGATGAYPAGAYPNSAYPGYPAYGQGRFSAEDQRQFDKYYAKWVDARRKNDQDDIDNNARKMEEIMARYNVPSNVPFDQLATNGNAGPYPAGPNQAAYPTYGYQGRLTAEDQRNFDKYYSKWMEGSRTGNQNEVMDNARKMQEIMARYNIPANLPFAQVASGYGGYGAAYPNGAYGYPYGPQRLSADDQHNFDKYYKKWRDARRKNDRDDIDSNARKMQDIMARYNIPANVPFDQIASAGAVNR